ncbi:EAL domain-containing protein [Halomonas sp. hl-4]|uniref:EAL domain-containing protein n=1 Tax=Halomonas sp. hl-4 TaxID=1761789 RepID=UPI000BB99033|nr:EAL domain-containing protein [Halomonas sp. hl-4]SNY98321.1 PAS domain S-box-containing protein/diguanylate cyclase (GGDEF) domain-containing protein [Halomonas sp. hl-4]
MHTGIEAADIFRQLAEGMGQTGTPQFYPTLVERLSNLLGVDHVFVASVSEENCAQTLAVWSNGRHLPNITYSLAGTPCESVVGHAPCLYSCGVQRRFPHDHLLEELGAESYMGMPLFASDGTPIGLLALLKNSPMSLDGLASEVLSIVAAQAGAELGRQQAEAALKNSEAAALESERRLDTLLNHLPGMAYRCRNDDDWTMELVSQGAYSLTGYHPHELVGNQLISFAELTHAQDASRVFHEVQKAIDDKRPYQVIYRLHHRDGRLRWMWEQGQAVFDEAGDVACLEGFISDVTDNHEAQRVQQAVMQVASTVTSRVGDDYFQQLIGTLVELLDADGGFIAVLNRPSHEATERSRLAATVSTVSVIADGEPLSNQTFVLSGSPSEQVVSEREAVAHSGQYKPIPGKAIQAQAWIGRRLDNADGEAIGVMMVFYREPLNTNAFATSVLRILSTGASAELERRRDQRRMYQLAYIDGTTGLANRVRFMEVQANMLREAAQKHHSLRLILLDIRRFKEINDTHGHQVGDQLLATIAGRLQHAIPEGSTLARLSGDEFAILVTNPSEAQLTATLDGLCDAVGKTIRLEHNAFNLEVSIGFACYPTDASVAGELFKAASIALHHAKRDGGVCPFSHDMMRLQRRRQKMAERLHQAVVDNRLSLCYQPQVNLETGQLTGAEALCRWYEPGWGWISPGEFIPLAEERGLIRVLGDWVLAEASRQLGVWRAQGKTLPGRLSINIAAQQFADPQLASHIADITQDVPASALALELTESDFMRDPDQAVAITQAMRAAGYALYIDDFGTGYSSLSYLRRFAPDALKIDISFVRDMLDNQHDRAIVQTIIAMAKALEMKTLAEGVEHQEQATLLADMGCLEAQGFLFGRPQPADEFAAEWLAR